MKILLEKKDRITVNSVCAIGSFDGVHRGHQSIVKELKRLAGGEKKVGIITFLPLPFFVLKSAPIIYLTLKEEKEAIFRELGVDFIYYFRFTRRFAELDARDFVEMVARKISPHCVVVGENFHFGKGRVGSAKALQKFAEGLFTVKILPRLKDGGTISSTRIRELILLGNIKAANRLLGREYTISGRVIRGKGKGAKLGFPTVNIRVDRKKLMPLDGVYKVRVVVSDGIYLGAMFCREHLIEVHILDFSGDLYRKRLSVRVIERIRDIEEFSGDEALRAAIMDDVRSIRDSLS
ncbi:MAG TPA: riboflavin biosynthesis protein RibF [candidate division WOR-3 bacterium]|uniref:Riboflavin biosynthesis protein n=1 Tax=candidate division WOR-3 bacterium TaxID=2052148 RepID=A0A9C9EN09_UNCW3|nr:riboflavin biosynthesis protein RibF [candidate division WOR-3 bacterium]